MRSARPPASTLYCGDCEKCWNREAHSAALILRADSGNTLGFNWSSDHWLDVAVFEEPLGKVNSHSPRDIDASAIDGPRSRFRLYAGELLEGIYDDWALFDRQCMRSPVFQQPVSRLARNA